MIQTMSTKLESKYGKREYLKGDTTNSFRWARQAAADCNGLENVPSILFIAWIFFIAAQWKTIFALNVTGHHILTQMHQHKHKQNPQCF